MLTKLVDYDYYKNTYGGSSIPESSFELYSKKASVRINYFTSNKITEILLNNDIKDSLCEIADLLQEQDKLIESQNNDQQEVASETVGPHSKSYVNKASLRDKRILTKEELNSECYKICYRYLAHTGLMYRGIN